MSLGNLSLPSIQNLAHQESISCNGGGGSHKNHPTPHRPGLYIFSRGDFYGIFLARMCDIFMFMAFCIDAMPRTSKIAQFMSLTKAGNTP